MPLIVLTSLSFLIPNFIKYCIVLHHNRSFKKALFICSASKLGVFRLRVVMGLTLFKYLSIKTEVVTSKKIPKGDYDIIVVFGGNTFDLMEWSIKNDLKDLILNTLKKGGIYIGESAGAIIVSPSIELARHVNIDKISNPNLKDFSGFGFIKFVPCPHFKNKYKKEINKYEYKFGYKVIPIRNNQYVAAIPDIC